MIVRIILMLLFLYHTMNIRTKREKKIFTYKFIKFMLLSPCFQDVIDIINANTQQVLNVINSRS